MGKRFFRKAGFCTLVVSICAVGAVTVAAADVAAEPLSQPEFRIKTEKDVRIPMRDGAYLVADVFRPDAPGRFPVIMTQGIYQKDLDYLPHGVPPFTHRETPNPDWWTPRGYVQIRVDARGSGKTPGSVDVISMQQAIDFYDAIEWAGKQSWSNGNVGLLGVSYYALTQWNVASLQPPSLKAIVPWEGLSDLYRDGLFQGGIFNSGFAAIWYTHVMGRQLLDHTRPDNPAGLSEHFLYNAMAHPLDGPYWDHVKARAQFDRINVPLYSVGNWDGWSLHLRGNIEGYVRSASKHKKLRVHVGEHTEAFYSEEGKRDQLRFLDHWLKGKDTGIMEEPPVKIFVRTGPTRDIDLKSSETPGFWRSEDEWPIARASYVKYYLTDKGAGMTSDAEHEGGLSRQKPAATDVISYPSGPEAYARSAARQPMASFVSEPMSEDTEITGHINLVLWAASETDDMDVFATLVNQPPDGPPFVVTRGILKASHRKLDRVLSRPDRPFHTHEIEQKLTPGEPVELQVELVATSMMFKRGHRIRIDISPQDGRLHYDGLYKTGDNSIYFGGDQASYVLLPLVPKKARR